MQVQQSDEQTRGHIGSHVCNDEVAVIDCNINLLGLNSKNFLAKWKKLDGSIVWNAHNTVLGEEALLIYIVPVC